MRRKRSNPNLDLLLAQSRLCLVEWEVNHDLAPLTLLIDPGGMRQLLRFSLIQNLRKCAARPDSAPGAAAALPCCCRRRWSLRASDCAERSFGLVCPSFQRDIQRREALVVPGARVGAGVEKEGYLFRTVAGGGG